MVAGMLMPLRELRAIYEVLFRDGVMVAKKDKRPQAKHAEVEGVSNLQVIRAMGSLKSRGYVKETFAWRHFYWYLTNEGIVYLRDFLRLPPEIVPASLQRIRKPAATLSVAHRAARVQSVEGPTSYVPKPGRWGESESQEAQAERQGYRHKMMGPGEREGYSNRTPRFRGRPQAAGPARPKASWEVEDQPQSSFRKGNSFTRESVVMEESRMRAVRQPPGASAERQLTKTQERVVSEALKAPLSAPVRREELKQDVSQTTLTSVYSKPALPLAAAAVALATGATTSKITAAEPAPKTNYEKLNIQDEKASMKQSKTVTYHSAITTLPGTEAKEEKTKKAIVEDPIKSAEAKAPAEPTTEKVKSQELIPAAASQETSKLIAGAGSAAPVITKSTTTKEAKDEKTKTQIADPVKPAAVKPQSKKEATKLKAQTEIIVDPVQKTSKPVSDSVTTSTIITKPVNKDVKEIKATNGIALEVIKPAEIKAQPEPESERVKSQAVITMAASQETSKPTATPVPVVAKPDKDFKEKKSNKVSVDQSQLSADKAVSEKPADEVKAELVLTPGTAQDTGPARVTAVSTEPLNVKVKKEKLQGTKVDEGSVKPSEVKTPVEPNIKHEKAKKTSKLTQDTTQPQTQSTTSESVMSTDSVVKTSKVEVAQVPIDAQVTVVSQSLKPKSDEMPPQTTTVVESSVFEVKTSVGTKPVSAPSAEDEKTIRSTVTEVVTKQEKADVKGVPIVKKEEKIGQEASVVSVQSPALGQKDLPSGPVSQKADMEVDMKTTQTVGGSSKSKKKKKKSPGEISKISSDEGPRGSELEKEEITCPGTPPEEVDDIALQPTLLLASAPPPATSLKPEEASLEKENKTQSKKEVDMEEIKTAPKQTDVKVKMSVPKKGEDQSDSKAKASPVEQISTVTQEKVPDNAKVKEQTEGGSVRKITQGPLSAVDKSDVKLTHVEPMKSEETTGTKVETVIVQKITQVEHVQASPKLKEQSLATVTEPHKLTSEIKSPVSAGKAAEEAPRGKKKGKGKKQAQAPTAERITAESVRLPEAESLQPTDSTSSPKNSVKDSPVMASELTENVSPKMTPERMCSEETRQAAAVLSEAPADKGEVESAPLFAEKIKREVPKPKTSLTAREAHTAGELASAAPALTAEAAVAQAQASPLAKREEPPKVAQHSASQSAERSTEKRLSVSEALKQEEEKKKDLEEDTPSVSATPAAAQPDQPHLGDICESESPDIDAMRKKIVVVEEIVEVKQIISPPAEGGQSPPPPVIPEEEGEELDLDVLEALAIERALLSGVEEATAYGASPDPEWDHSLEEPEEKTWPNFIEGWEVLGWTTHPPRPLLPPSPLPQALRAVPPPMATGEQGDGS
ncbi:uncharacterized protein LOC141800536 [Halichoeres trimaculatus]|uniref:uncharacterized protein LOC141800536 n=1 Tax=Halichoeres trimaculatus TaxID=147232 RepID=UPI003D9ECBF3